MKIQFLGAARTVTGSRFLLKANKIRALIDCGLFQGPRVWREKNWEDFPVDPAKIDCVILTHAHIDHTGFLPRFMALGFRGPVYCTPATADLLTLMLPDSGRIQEEDAAFINKKQISRHTPALPLYTEDQARAVLELVQPVDYYSPTDLVPDELVFSFLRAGHILGSAMVEMKTADKKIVFTGDLGRPHQFIIKSPDLIRETDYLIMESTYGNRLHQEINVLDHLAELITTTVKSGGSVIVPSFAIGRAQELLYLLRVLLEEKRIPQIPIFIDSPMAVHAIPFFTEHIKDYSSELTELSRRDNTPYEFPGLTAIRSIQESIELNKMNYPSIIISSNGMATAGRILHHMKRRISDARHTILFIGFQAEGTKGRYLIEGGREIRIHKKMYPVRARIEYIDALSCHADYRECLQWLSSLERAPQQIFLVHGEESASLSMAEKISAKFQYPVHVPVYLEEIELR